MTVFTVDTDAVLAAQGAAHATMARLQSESASLMAQLNQLQSSWAGTAAQSFQGCAEEWRGAQLHLEQSLESIGSSLASAAAQYADADLYSASLFR